MPATTKFEIFTETPYTSEYIVALSCVGSLSGSLPSSETLMWYICDIAFISDITSLSGVFLQSMGKLQNHGIQTVTHTTTAGGILYYDMVNVPLLSSYCIPTFNFMAGTSVTLSLSGLSSQGPLVYLNSTQSASGYVYTDDTKTYFISNWGSIDIMGTALSATYIADNGTYTPNTLVNASTANILYLQTTDTTHMYKISSVLSTVAISNTALEIFPDYPLTLALSSMYFNNFPEIRELTLEVTNPLSDITSRLSGQNVAVPNTISFIWNYDAPVGGTVTQSTTSYINNEYDITTGTFDATTRQAVLSTYTFNVSAISASNVIFSDSYVLPLDEFPDETSFGFTTIVLNNDPADVGNKMWRLISNNSVFAEVTTNIPGLDPTQGNLGLSWGDGDVLSFVDSPTATYTVEHVYSIYGRMEQIFTTITTTTSGLSASGSVSITPFNSGSLIIGVSSNLSGFGYNLWDTTPGILTAAGVPVSGTIDYGTGNWFIDFFNKELLTSGTLISGAYTLTPVLTTFRITSFAEEISATNWLSAHSKY